jgi:hypothetical protein
MALAVLALLFMTAATVYKNRAVDAAAKENHLPLLDNASSATPAATTAGLKSPYSLDPNDDDDDDHDGAAKPAIGLALTLQLSVFSGVVLGSFAPLETLAQNGTS